MGACTYAWVTMATARGCAACQINNTMRILCNFELFPFYCNGMPKHSAVTKQACAAIRYGKQQHHKNMPTRALDALVKLLVAFLHRTPLRDVGKIACDLETAIG